MGLETKDFERKLTSLWLWGLMKKRVFSTQAFFRLQQGVFMLYLSIIGYIRGVGHLHYNTRPTQYRETVTAFSLNPPPRPGDSLGPSISLWKAT